MRLNCDAHLGVNTAQERDVPTFPPGGGHAPSRRSTQNAPAEWTPPRRVARPRAPRLLEYVRATFRRGLRFACNSQPNTTANRGTVAGHEVITRSLSPPFLRQLQLEVSRSITRSADHFEVQTTGVKTATKAATDLKACDCLKLHSVTRKASRSLTSPFREQTHSSKACQPPCTLCRAPPCRCRRRAALLRSDTLPHAQRSSALSHLLAALLAGHIAH